ncbi:hypothetical protein GJ629_11390 [Halapricum sp. CBA1109]|uniref:hypothetical protein n=1 Tax=Halapricum sp. CBA1109 TaxID=2668068 RepID=UPI0012FA5465|nr:hypothetical protein [Halapricum sp. CBA1109]MUV90432.1 hypothetical protein [Halapricum sp. CBA1109]
MDDSRRLPHAGGRLVLAPAGALRDADDTALTRERFARALGLATVASLFVSTLVVPPDVGTTAVGLAVGTVLGVPVVYLLLGASTQPKS